MLIMTKERVSASVFADSLGVQRSNISHILSGRNKPSLEFIQKIVSSYPKYNIEWLVMGSGNPTTTTQTETKDSIRESKPENALFTSVNAPEKEQAAPINTTTNITEKQNSEGNTPLVSQTNAPIQPEKAIKEIIICYTDQTFLAYKPQ